MPVCAACGESSPEGARFCQACGARLGETPPQLRKTITSLFCDLVGSTALAESLEDPEAIHNVLTRYLSAMTKILERHGGTVQKFAGDAILGTFGVPVSHEDDALRAVRAAVEMREGLSSLNVELEARWGIALQLKIGINSGEVLTGDAIAGQPMALGDPMNVAARLEQTAEPGEIILGEPTFRLVGRAVEADPPRRLSLKGKSAPVAAYPLVRLLPEPPPAARSYTRPMVGRRRELQALREAYERVVRDETGAVLVIIGTPGVGKSRLAAAFTGELDGEATIYATRSPSYGEHASFWPLAQAVQAHAGVVASDDAATVEAKLIAAVHAVVEDRGERLWIAARLASLAGLASADERAADTVESFDAWRRFLECVAVPRPVVLVCEDLHWAKGVFLDFLGHLAGCRARILVLGTARPDLDEHELGGTATFLRLEPLTADETGALVDGIAGRPLPIELRGHVVARAGGNPLFAEALVTMINERHLARTDVVEVPDTVEALVAARLDALPPLLRSLVFDAAVVGSAIPAEALSSMGKLDRGVVENGVRDLVGQEFLRAVEGGDEYEFWHGLVSEIAYREIPRAARSAKHRAFAEWLETRSADAAADLLAHHYGRAYDLAVEARETEEVRRHVAERSFRYGVLAAARALRATDAGSAATILSRAVQALTDVPAPDLDAVGEAGRLLVALARWSEATDLLVRFAESGHQSILRELGIAMCKLYRDNLTGAEYRRGQAYLERAAAYGDTGAIASLAGSWKGIDETRVRELYRSASEIDPADPYPLGNLLEYEILSAGDLSPVEGMRDRITAAIERCRQQVAVGQNLPWAYYDLGKFHLLLGLPHESLALYTKGIDLSPAVFMLETSVASLERMAQVAARLPGLAWSRDLLALALRSKSDEDATEGSITLPVVILAGGTSPEDEEQIAALRPVILEAFSDFTGTIISGGTVQGVSGLVGELGGRYPEVVRTIGYLPRSVPAVAKPDARYHEVRRTEADSFSPLEPLRYWDDLVRAGVRPPHVTMIGIGGGRVAAAEYAIALALGATLGVIRGSGRAADDILADPHWSSTRRLRALGQDPEAIRSFLGAAR